MENNNDALLRNLEIEKERAELERQKEELLFQRAQVSRKLDDRFDENMYNKHLYNQELDDIRLNKDSSNKQKYILLGFILVLLFLITLVTIKLISEPQKNNDYVQNSTIDEPKNEPALENVNNNLDNNETIINQSVEGDKIIQTDADMAKKPEETVVSNLSNHETVQTAQKPIESDIFGVKKIEQVIIPEKQIKPEEKQDQTKKTQLKNTEKKDQIKKPEIKKSATKNIDTKENLSKKEVLKSDNNLDIFIQAGAFTAIPDQNIIQKLKKNNFKFIFRKVEIDGKIYSKLFIGGYKNREKAMEDLSKIRSEINPKAFIPKDQ